MHINPKMQVKKRKPILTKKRTTLLLIKSKVLSKKGKRLNLGLSFICNSQSSLKNYKLFKHIYNETILINSYSNDFFAYTQIKLCE